MGKVNSGREYWGRYYKYICPLRKWCKSLHLLLSHPICQVEPWKNNVCAVKINTILSKDSEYLISTADKSSQEALRPDPFELYNERATQNDHNFVKECYESMDTMLVFVSHSSLTTRQLSDP